MVKQESFSTMKHSEHGFSILGILLVLVTLSAVGAAGYFVSTGTLPFIGRKPVALGQYDLWLDANQGSDFTNEYSLGLSGTQNTVSGKKGAIKTVSLRTTDRSGTVTVKVQAYEKNWERPSCELIESWFCDPPKLETRTELPKSALKNNTETSLVLKVDGKEHHYKLVVKDYRLSLQAENGEKTNTLPYYPDGIANAVAIHKQKNSLCENVGSDQITQLLRDNQVKLAADKYPGVEQVRPSNVLVQADGNRLQDVVTTPDGNGCVVKLLHVNLKSL